MPVTTWVGETPALSFRPWIGAPLSVEIARDFADHLLSRQTAVACPVSLDRSGPPLATLSSMDQEVVSLRAHHDHRRLSVLGDDLDGTLVDTIQVLAGVLSKVRERVRVLRAMHRTSPY